MPDLDIQGHRGARGLLPENTIPAFIRALELGVTTLEMDVVITQDEQVVVSHEPWFSHEICTQPDGTEIPVEADHVEFSIYQMPYAEAARYDCGMRGNPRFPEQQPMPIAKPLLRDVIAAAETHRAEHDLAPFDYNIETKSTPDGDGVFHPGPERFTELLYDVVVEAGIKDRTTLQSFDFRTLRVGREIDPDWRLVMLIGSNDTSLDEQLEDLGFTPWAYSPYHPFVDEDLVAAVHAAGMKLIPWTVNTVAEMQALVGLGVDGIITDYPDRAQALK